MIDGRIDFERYDTGFGPEAAIHLHIATKGFWGSVITARRPTSSRQCRSSLMGCKEGISSVKTTHQQGTRNCTRWRTPLKFLIAANLLGWPTPV